MLSLPLAGEPREESALMPIESLFLPPACLDHTNGVRSKQKWNDVYNAEKKSYTVIYWGKNFQLQRFGKEIIGRRLTQTKSPIPPLPPAQNSHVFLM